jgi:hypothetical protein
MIKFRYEPGDEVGIGGGSRTVHAVVVSDNGDTVTVDSSIDDLASIGEPRNHVFTVSRSRVHPSVEDAVPYAGKRAQGGSSALKAVRDDLKSWLKANDPTYWTWIQGIGLTRVGGEDAIQVGYRTDSMPPILNSFAEGQRWQGLPVRIEAIGEIYPLKTASGTGEGPGLGVALAVSLGTVGLVGLGMYLLNRKGTAESKFGAAEYIIGLQGSAFTRPQRMPLRTLVRT